MIMEEIIVLKTCECGCGKITTIFSKKPRRFIIGHISKTELNGFRGKRHTAETKKKLSEIKKRMFVGEKNPFYGRHHTKKTKEKIKKSLIKNGAIKRASERMKKNNPMSNIDIIKKHFLGKNNPAYGKKYSKKQREQMSNSRKGRKLAEQAKKNISESKKGNKNPMYGKSGPLSPRWRGGVSFEPYPIVFNDKLKRKIRDRDSHICQLCKTPENGQKLSIHHIDYDKQNNETNNLISLCRSCHSRAQNYSDFWIEKFPSIINK